jgi:hypothetical protein
MPGKERQTRWRRVADPIAFVLICHTLWSRLAIQSVHRWRELQGHRACPNILREPAFQVAFVNCDDVIQEITPATPYPTLCDSILPRTFERSAERIHPQGSNRCGDLQSILGITIKDDEPRSGSKWKCFSQLLHDP